MKTTRITNHRFPASLSAGFSGGLTAGLVAGLMSLGVTGCASQKETTAGVMPSARLSALDVVVKYDHILMPDWARIKPLPGTELSPDEEYLRAHAFDLASPSDDAIPLFRRPVYNTKTGMKLGPHVTGHEGYYVRRSYQWHASQEARVNVLLADLQRSNARIEDYRTVAERVLATEEKRIEAVYEMGLDKMSAGDKRILIAHSIGARNVMAYALAPIPDRLKSYAYAAKRARIDVPDDPVNFAIEAEIATLASHVTTLSHRVAELDQQITDLLTAPS